MRSKMYDFFQMIHNIQNIWDQRGVEDALAEPEWDDYESFLYVIAEFVCGDRTWGGELV